MKKEDFLQELVDSMEMSGVVLQEDTVFKELPDFDSMSVMSIVALVDEKFAKRLSAEQLSTMKTVKNLMELVGMEHFQ